MTKSGTDPSDDEDTSSTITDESRFDDLVEEIDADPDSDADVDPESNESGTTPEGNAAADEQSEADSQPEAEPAFMQQSRQRTTPSGPRSAAGSLSRKQKIQLVLLVFFAVLLIVSLLWEVAG